MCDVISADLITKVLNEFVDEEKSFTAFDVSWEVKNRGGKERHTDMRVEIHNQMALHLQNNYQQSTISIKDPIKGTVNAQLFHHFMSDPNEYEAKDRSKLMKKSSDPVQTPLDDGDGTSNNGTSKQLNGNPKTISITKKRDAFGRLLIPTLFLRELGVKPSGIVNVFVDWVGGTIVVSKDAPTSGNYHKTRCVERDGDIRVSATLFVKAGIVGDEYDITSTNRGVEITLHG